MNEKDKLAWERACDALYGFGYSEQFSMALWQAALEYARQPAQAEPDLLDLKLPIAIRVGGGIFGKGVSLRSVANQLKRIQDTYSDDLKARMSKQSICRQNENEAPAVAVNEQMLEHVAREKQHIYTMNQFKECCRGTNCTATKARPTHSQECIKEHDALHALQAADTVHPQVAAAFEKCLAWLNTWATEIPEVKAVNAAIAEAAKKGELA